MANQKSTLILKGTDGVPRCWWCGHDALYVQYHDLEWGQPVGSDQRLFEKICLEGFQAGLSWLTILRKRAAFREAFDDFDIERVSRFTGRDVNRLVKNASIVRHRGKIESTANNARRAIDLISEQGSLADFFWQFEPARKRIVVAKTDIPAKTDESTAMSKALKRRGWSFVGPTTCYAFMQSMGIVNDHAKGCRFYAPTKLARKNFER